MEGLCPRSVPYLDRRIVPSMVRRLCAVIALACALALGAMAYALPAQATAPRQELDEGVRKGNPPKGMDCVKQLVFGRVISKACFDYRRDEIWVKDFVGVTHSAVALWEIRKDRRPPSLRKGFCRNRFGAGTWAACDKTFRYRHRHKFYWQAARYEPSTNQLLPARSKILVNWVR
jgi:hypothetical protein